ncbi:Transporter [Giardia duodenalis]|uniref:Transporter n=1 Tax=Giardia intestinalis TaxID=5741 RepID=V6TLQ8_GIAIN|nr:Transporter [Giardia intestinalis]
MSAIPSTHRVLKSVAAETPGVVIHPKGVSCLRKCTFITKKCPLNDFILQFQL